MLIFRKPWNSQPQGAVGTDRSNPLAYGLVATPYASTSPFDATGTFTYTVASPRPPAPSPYGLAYDGARGTYWRTQQNFSTVAGTPLTVAGWIKPGFSDTSIDCVFMVGTFAAASKGLAIFLNLSAAGEVYVTTTNGDRYTAGGQFTAGQWFHLAVVYRGGQVDQDTFDIYVNGVKKSTTSAGAATNLLTIDASPIEFGGDIYTANREFRGLIGPISFWTRALIQPEVVSHRDNPWQLFEPRRIITPTSAGGGPSLDIAASPLAIAGAVTTTGDIQVGTSFNLTASPLSIAGALTTTGNLQIGTSFNLVASPLAIAGAVTTTGDIQITPGGSLDLVASPLAIAGAVTTTGDIQIGTSFNLSASALAIAGAVTTTGDIQIGTSFNLVASPLAIVGGVAITGDIQIATEFNLTASPLAIAGTLGLTGDLEYLTSNWVPVSTGSSGSWTPRATGSATSWVPVDT